uniref:Uncharacterized protein n=1 Tax=Kalanchoe fedtschenkoi TaxID=63787 RepID=A0A7N0SZ38_KALFE
MSVSLSRATLLLVLFAYIQNNKCCARPHAFEAAAAVVPDEDTSQKSNLTDNKNDDHKSNLTARKDLLGLQTAYSGKPSKTGISNNDNIVKVGARSHKRRSSKRSSMKMISRQAKTGGGGTKVSYRVPHRKRGEQQPGFNLDYSPPKVHPPHHN